MNIEKVIVMALMEKITEDMKAAMRAQEKAKLGTIKFLKAAIANLEIEKKRQLTDEEILNVVSSVIKQVNVELESVVQAGRNEREVQLRAELVVLKTYLPEQLSEAEVSILIAELIKNLGLTSPKEKGKLMGALMPAVKGKIDSAIVNKLVGELLA